MTVKSIELVPSDILGVLNGDAGEVRIPINDIKVRAERKPREFGKMWASDIGEKCLRKLWYKFNEVDDPSFIAPLDTQPPELALKFTYGHLLEDLVLNATRLAGHSVEYEQLRVESEAPGGWMVSGRVDAVIDNCMVDVKSVSSYGYKKYTQEGLTVDNDSFGYRFQLGYYFHNADTGKVLDETTGLLCVDKQHGHVAFIPVDIPTKEELDHKIEDNIHAIEAEHEEDVERGWDPEVFGKTGNLKLPIACSFCDFKHTCYRDSNGGVGLRTFNYKFGPVDMVHVENEPRVEEVVPDV